MPGHDTDPSRRARSSNAADGFAPTHSSRRAEVVEDRREPSDVVLVGVRGDHDIQPADAAGPRDTVRRRPPRYRDSICRRGRIAGCLRRPPTCAGPAGQHQQQAVALADVDGSRSSSEPDSVRAGEGLPQQQTERRQDQRHQFQLVARGATQATSRSAAANPPASHRRRVEALARRARFRRATGRYGRRGAESTRPAPRPRGSC